MNVLINALVKILKAVFKNTVFYIDYEVWAFFPEILCMIPTWIWCFTITILLLFLSWFDVCRAELNFLKYIRYVVITYPFLKYPLRRRTYILLRESRCFVVVFMRHLSCMFIFIEWHVYKPIQLPYIFQLVFGAASRTDVIHVFTKFLWESKRLIKIKAFKAMQSIRCDAIFSCRAVAKTLTCSCSAI